MEWLGRKNNRTFILSIRLPDRSLAYHFELESGKIEFDRIERSNSEELLVPRKKIGGKNCAIDQEGMLG